MCGAFAINIMYNTHHHHTMNRIYKYQRHFYDITRPFFLPGRNRLLRMVAPRPNECILEIGCGTARNLIYLAQIYGDAHFFGIDVSEQMLATALNNVRHAACTDRVVLHQGAAETVDPVAVFSRSDKFDRIFFSYSLSMMADWRAALDMAKTALKSSGSLYVVDFWDLHRWPQPIVMFFYKWFALFHVHFEKNMPNEIERRFPHTVIQPLWRHYAFLAYAG